MKKFSLFFEERELKTPSKGRQFSYPKAILLSHDELTKKINELDPGAWNPDPKKVGAKLNGFYHNGVIYLNSEAGDDDTVSFGMAHPAIAKSIQSYYYHELGHHLYEKVLSQSERKSWEEVYNKVRPDYWRSQISYKAGGAPSEAFSELYAAYQLGVSAEDRLKANKKAWPTFISIIENQTPISVSPKPTFKLKTYKGGFKLQRKLGSGRQ